MGEHTAAAHLAERAEAAADKLEGRAGGTYQAQIEHAAVRASCMHILLFLLSQRALPCQTALTCRPSAACLTNCSSCFALSSAISYSAWVQANFEEAGKGEASGGTGMTDQSTAPVSEELETHAETLTQAASRMATQVVAGVRDGAVGVVSSIRTEVAKCVHFFPYSVYISGLERMWSRAHGNTVSVTTLSLLQDSYGTLAHATIHA